VEAVESAKAVESGKSGEAVYRVLCIVYRLSCIVYRWFWRDERNERDERDA